MLRKNFSLSTLLFTFAWLFLGVPESPRWLVSKERYDEALDILTYYHANGDPYNATVRFEYREIKETICLEMQLQKDSSYLDFMKTRGNRYRLALLVSLGIISQYSGNALFTNYTNLIYNSMGITEESKKIPVRSAVFPAFGDDLLTFFNTSLMVEIPFWAWLSVCRARSLWIVSAEGHSSLYQQQVTISMIIGGMLVSNSPCYRHGPDVSFMDNCVRLLRKDP